MKLFSLGVVFSIVALGLAEDPKSPFEFPGLKKALDEIIAKSEAPARQNKTLTGRITKGVLASIAQFPYQTYLIMTFTDGKKYLCGGAVSFVS